MREQASTIYQLMESRGCREYLDMVPELLEQVGLEVDISLDARCLPGLRPSWCGWKRRCGRSLWTNTKGLWAMKQLECKL